MKIHHIAIICSDYEVSKKFYTEILDLNIIREVYRKKDSLTSSILPSEIIMLLNCFRFRILRNDLPDRNPAV
jgi:catechol 2,3-dioxygenase-like lactoylglutathione lyase family enzyme